MKAARRLGLLTVLGACVLTLGLVPASDARAHSARPQTSSTSRTSTSPTASSAPAPICEVTASVKRCFAWRRRDPWSSGASIYTNDFVVGASQPGVRAYAAWINSATTDLALYPGYEGPGPTPLPRGPEEVPPTARGRLLATFNAGFYEADAKAGFYVNHTLYFPMIRGLATVVRYANGRVDVVSWQGGARPGANVVMARQNLSLLVSNARASALSANNAAWGLTLHGVAAVWRTALGVDAKGNLIYVAAPDQTSASLAHLLVSLHVVRAMELDINPEWPIFVTYGAPGAVGATLFVPNPNQIAGRFLYPSTKDFFAVYASRRPGETQPW
ncbi:MAG: phosphodiester glycosidase family protein [Acidobacteriota bacterium]|nr:phosphodiester glycosidase family protein [Acidobacteriota bacterium]MDE3108023.1 phosphodiester glycosidase family protein [Acidobacteriota bacterium]